MRQLKLQTARQSRGYIPPRFYSPAMALMNAAKNLYLNQGEHLKAVKLINPEPFCRALKEQQEKRYRLILLFRHSDKADAPALMYAINTLAPKEGRPRKIRFVKRPHAVFLYGKDVPNWAGALAAWIFPRLGYIPVVNRGLCRESVDDIRSALDKNPFPIALAPEGQVTYHAHKMSGFENGVMHMADWASEYGDVRLLPMAICYDYGNKRSKLIRKVRARWIKETGVSLSPVDPEKEVYSLLMEMTDKTLEILEQSFPPGKTNTDGALCRDERIEDLNQRILAEGERIAHIRKSGTLLDRIFKLRYKGMDSWYPECENPVNYPPWKQSRSDYECLKAALYVRNSQIADVLEYIHTDYIDDSPLNNRHCEYALNILDLINRYKGGDIGSRYMPVKRKALILTGEALDPADIDRNLKKRQRYEKTGQILQERLKALSLEIEKVLTV